MKVRIVASVVTWFDQVVELTPEQVADLRFDDAEAWDLLDLTSHSERNGHEVWNIQVGNEIPPECGGPTLRLVSE